MSVTVSITRANIYAIAEGISVTISQHNGGTPTFEQLWASADEAKKLDIWYREAISDLERRLMRWVLESSGQFDLAQDGANYTLTLVLSQYWPNRLKGLLDNKVQDYLVNSVTAGWLNDFDGLTVKQDYQAMASQDLADIIDIICMQSFGFDESSRQGDGSSKSPSTIDADKRQGDGSSKSPSTIDADKRQGDGSSKSPSTIDADKRQGDGSSKSPSTIDADKRQGDTGKNTQELVLEAGYRKKDNAQKNCSDTTPPLARERTCRHKDNAIVDTRRSYTDASGTDFGYSIDDPKGEIYRRDPNPMPRPAMGMGFTPSPGHPPVPEPPAPKPPMEPEYYEQPPVQAVPPKYAPQPEYHADGKGWSDEATYDMEAEEKYINSHICGQHDLEDDADLFQTTDEHEQ